MREVMRYPYKTKDDHVVGYVSRLEDLVSGDSKSAKKTIPHFNNGKQGIPKEFLATRRIYGIKTVKDNDRTVYVVEGEKCAFALQGLGFQAISTLGGCKSVHLADFSELSGMKRFVLLPDNDDVGEEYMQKVYRALRKLSPSPDVRLVYLPNLPEKGDICDYLSSMTDLKGWNELESLSNNPNREAIVAHLTEVFSAFEEGIPLEWNFSTTKGNHRLVSVNALNNMKLPERAVLMEPWLAESSVNMIFADRGVGKTFFSLSCAVALANGEDFLSYKVEKPVNVLYLDAEMNGVSMQWRLKQLTKGKDTKCPLKLYNPDFQPLGQGTPDIGEPLGRSALNDMISDTDPQVIFIDNVSTFMRNGKENDGDYWAPVNEWVTQMRKEGRTIVFVHHANKEGKQRGSGRKEDAMSTIIQLKRSDDPPPDSGGTNILVGYTKTRDMNTEQSQEMKTTLETVDGYLSWDWNFSNEKLERIRLLSRKGDSVRDIAEELDMSKSSVHRWIEKLKEQ